MILCKDCEVFINRYGADECIKRGCTKGDFNEFSDVVTVDYDGLDNSFYKLIQMTDIKGKKLNGNIVKEAFFRVSSSGKGTHLKLVLDKKIGFDERIMIREQLGDCEARVRLDREDRSNNRDTDILYYSKAGNKVMDWIELTQENVVAVLNV